MKRTTKDVRLAQRLSATGAEEQPRLAFTDELDEQLRYALGQIDLAVTIDGLEEVLLDAAPHLAIDDDSLTLIGDLLDFDTEGFTDTESARRTENVEHPQLSRMRLSHYAAHYLLRGVPPIFASA
jgi:hypothetical protein